MEKEVYYDFDSMKHRSAGTGFIEVTPINGIGLLWWQQNDPHCAVAVNAIIRIDPNFDSNGADIRVAEGHAVSVIQTAQSYDEIMELIRVSRNGMF